ncbi:hypothetical protein RA28_01490 [Ruegeria sp. ANG-S4]|uniref:DUF6173 family protein n=1 Tax=Ruegeria sp. ANG-S4 TaxID=1577904 RepID=UPI00057D8ED5|nr:DUF6173 family protein [Ruegeria sp. ANG-S4]KIC47509.1 hypothetical protein RA28_01490 [Ruegeria sp. ANG-S4]
MQDEIETSAEAAEAAALPRCYEVHANSAADSGPKQLPKPLQQPVETKSPAQWAYERLIMYIQNFEKTLDGDQEVAMGFTGGDAGVMRIEGMGYFDPDMVTFYGSDGAGGRTQLVQHVTQLNVMLRALPKPVEDKPANRIGFRLAADLEES